MGSGNGRSGGHVSTLFLHDPDVEMTHHQDAENTELRGSVHVDRTSGSAAARRYAILYRLCVCHADRRTAGHPVIHNNRYIIPN